MGTTFDPLSEAKEIREQLGSDRRRLILLCGAGTSQAVGIDGIAELSAHVKAVLSGTQQEHYDRIVAELGTDSVEVVLGRLRLCGELVGSSTTAEVNGFVGQEAVEMDRAVCRAIYNLVSIDPPKGLKAHAEFAAWMNSIQREYAVEVFTTNYDLIIERGLEVAEVPYFDGFVGSVNPYFASAGIEMLDSDGAGRIPTTWMRLWKLHGSIGWRRAKEAITGAEKVIRTAVVPTDSDDLMIFPTRDKYSESRRMPFVAFHDRLRRLTAEGESLLLVLGYSFGDQHINEILYSSLRANNRLACTVFLYESLDSAKMNERLVKPTTGIQNLTIYSPDKAMIGGVLGEWTKPPKPPDGVDAWPFWDEIAGRFSLGDFANVPSFLNLFIGARPLAGVPSAAAPET